MMINIEMNGKYLTFVNLYAPKDEKERIVFFKKITNDLDDFKQGSVIIGGDFNEVLDKEDRRSRNDTKILRKSAGLTKLIKTNKLTDVWRVQNLKKQQFTWRRRQAE